MDARRTPGWILCDHLKDQLTDLFGDSAATADSFSHFAEHGPIQFESGLVPPNNSVRQDDDERLLPSRPEAASQYPKQLIEWSQSWPGMFAFQDGQLLPESEVFEDQAAAVTRDGKHSPEPEPKKIEHGGNVIADRIVGCGPM